MYRFNILKVSILFWSWVYFSLRPNGIFILCIMLMPPCEENWVLILFFFVLDVNGLMQYGASLNPFWYLLYLQMSYFLHELLQHVYSKYPFRKNCSHKFHIWKACFLHELMQYVFSSYPFRRSVVTNFTFVWFISFMNWCNMLIQFTLSRKTVVTNFTFQCLPSFLHELRQYVASSHLFMKTCRNKLHI